MATNLDVSRQVDGIARAGMPSGLKPRIAARVDWLLAPTSILPLVVFRVGFGLLMLAGIVRFVANNWIEEIYLHPDFHFKFLGFAWVQVPPGDTLYLIFFLMGLATLFIILGLFYRASIVTFFFLFTYVELLDKAYYLNHYYFISILSFLLIFLPLNRAGSLDARWNPRLCASTVPRWTIFVVRLQLGLVYFFAGLAKLNPDWMFHALPLRIWLPAHYGFPVLGALFIQPWFAFVMSWAGAFYDLTIPFFMSVRLSRPFAYIAVIGFHVLTGMLFNIGMFPWVMIACTLIFFDERDFAWIYGRIRALIPSLPVRTFESAVMTTHRPVLSKRYRLLLAGFAVYFVIQLLLPLRHWLYPGDSSWTQEGFRFAWRVMLVESAGYTTFFVRDEATGQRWVIDPDLYLTVTQSRQMAFQPDMILEFAHYLEDLFQQDGYDDVEVRVEAYVRYNRRSSRLLIDPDVDLTQYHASIWAKPFILRYDG